MPKPLETIAPDELANVGGGASRVTARSSSSDSTLTAMLTQITSSIQSLAGNRNQTDPTMMMMMMMMMMGGGGGGGGGPAAAPAQVAAPPAINIDTSAFGGGGGWGGGGGSKKGW